MNHSQLGIGLIAVTIALVGAYHLGQNDAPAAAALAPQTAAAPAPAPAAMPTATKAPSPDAPLSGSTGANLGDKFTHFRVGNKNVKALHADNGVMWVATSGGVVRYNTRKDEFKLYDVKSGLLSNGVFYVGRIQGKLTVGTYGGGLSVLDETQDQWKTYNIPEGLGDAFVYDVIETANGDIWVATWSGVNRIRGGKLDDRSAWELHTVASTQGGLPNDWVYGLAEGKHGEIWLATEGGMARFDNGQWENWNHARGVGAPYEKVKKAITFNSDPSKASVHHAQQKKDMGLDDVDQAYNPNYIVSLEVDADGSVWAGTWGGGLAHFKDGQWTNLTTFEGLPGNHVFMLHRDRKDRLWIGTNNGLALKEGDQFRILKAEDGLFNNTVFSMATTDDGGLWVGSFGGVAHLRGEMAVN